MSAERRRKKKKLIRDVFSSQRRIFICVQLIAVNFLTVNFLTVNLHGAHFYIFIHARVQQRKFTSSKNRKVSLSNNSFFIESNLSQIFTIPTPTLRYKHTPSDPIWLNTLFSILHSRLLNYVDILKII